MNDLPTKLNALEMRLTAMQQEVNEVLGQLVDTTNSMRKLQIEFARYIDNRVTRLEAASGNSDRPTESAKPAGDRETNTANGETAT